MTMGSSHWYILCMMRHGIILLLLSLALSFRLTPGFAAPTTNIIVDSLADQMANDDNCTLREALAAANTNAAVDNCPAGALLEQDTITFAVDGTIFLSSQLTVSGGITIIGNGQANTILDGQRVTRVIELSPSGRGVITLSDMSIQNGIALDDLGGGGIMGNEISHSLVLERVTLRGNESVNLGGGVSLYDYEGDLTIRQSAFLENLALWSTGGAFFIGPESSGCDAEFVVDESLFMGNSAGYGGAISAGCGSWTVRHSTFSGNWTFEPGILRFWDNSMEGIVTIENSTISDNEGVAIAAYAAGAGESELIMVRNSTLVDNSQGNFFLESKEGGQVAVTLIDSIVANNAAENCEVIEIGSGYAILASLGFNVTDSEECGFEEPTDIVADPLVLKGTLGPLQDNGGPTPTIALLTGNPAIDNGSCSGNNIKADQRGIPRPQGPACDIGAYEYAGEDEFKLFLPLVK